MKRRREMSSRAVASLSLVPLAALACAKTPVAHLPGMRSSPPAVSKPELREELAAFSARFASLVTGAGDRIREETSDPLVRRRLLLWQIRLVPLVQEAAFLPEPQEAFIGVGGLVVSMRRYLVEGGGARLFVPYQQIAIDAARAAEDDFFGVGLLFLTEEQVERLRAELDAYTERRPLAGTEFSSAGLQQNLQQARESGRFEWVVDVPMSPFRALEGVGSGASAIHDFNDTALRFARIVEGLPQQLRWQAELLIYDVESRERLMAGIAALESFAESARQLADAADRLPADLAELAGESQSALAEATRALETAQELVEPLRATAEQLNLAGASWGAMFAREGGRDPGARPFDIQEYQATARGIGEAAEELRGLAEDVGGLLESAELEQQLGGVDAVVSRAESGGRSVVDHAAWRALQLMLGFFALLLAYRFAVARIAPPRG